MKEINTSLSKNMVGKNVNHKIFGRGEVIYCSNVAMKVKFDDGERVFGFPYAFKQFLTVDDPELQKEIEEFYDSGNWLKPIHDHNCGE